MDGSKNGRYSREQFLELMQKCFGQYTVRNDKVKFQRHTHKEIARTLTMTPQYLSKLLIPLTLPPDHHLYEKPASYEFAIERLLRLVQVKEYEAYKADQRLYQEEIERIKQESERRNKRHWLVTSFMLICVVSTILWSGFFLDETSTNTEAITGLSGEMTEPRMDVNGEFLMEISPLPTLKQVIRHEGLLTVRSLQLESILFNQRIKNNSLLTKQDSLVKILELKTMIRRVIKTVRERNLDFRFSSEYYLKMIANEAVPPDTDFLFQCSEQQLLDAAFNGQSPVEGSNKEPTPFDLGLINSLPYLFNREINFDELNDRIGDQVLSSQDRIIFALERTMRAKIDRQ